MAHSVIELKTKAISGTEIPKGSWVDSDGKRWKNVVFDVMTDNGTKFVRQVKVKLGIHYNFFVGDYICDVDFGQPLIDEIIRQYPSLASVKRPKFLPTDNKVI